LSDSLKNYPPGDQRGEDIMEMILYMEYRLDLFQQAMNN